MDYEKPICCFYKFDIPEVSHKNLTEFGTKLRDKEHLTKKTKKLQNRQKELIVFAGKTRHQEKRRWGNESQKKRTKERPNTFKPWQEKK